MDVARRVYDHTFRIDPVIRTLMDTDFYKFLMQQMILGLHPKVRVTFRLINRTSSVRLRVFGSEGMNAMKVTV